MDEMEIAVARSSAGDLLARYTHYGDAGDADGFASLFGADGVLDVADGPKARGVAEVRSLMLGFLEANRSTPGYLPFRHHLSSVRLDVLSPDEVEASAYFAVLVPWGLDHWGTYQDHVRKTEDGWQFVSRQVTIEGAVERSPVAPIVAG
jgi:hypothetical protein